MSDAEQIAAFLATRGATKVAEGECAMDHRAMYRAVRGERSDPTQERHLRAIDHMGRELWVNGLGEPVCIV
jgi:hypothetical protein